MVRDNSPKPFPINFACFNREKGKQDRKGNFWNWDWNSDRNLKSSTLILMFDWNSDRNSWSNSSKTFPIKLDSTVKRESKIRNAIMIDIQSFPTLFWSEFLMNFAVIWFSDRNFWRILMITSPLKHMKFPYQQSGWLHNFFCLFLTGILIEI